jgi:hypothetical protein
MGQFGCTYLGGHECSSLPLADLTRRHLRSVSGPMARASVSAIAAEVSVQNCPPRWRGRVPITQARALKNSSDLMDAVDPAKPTAWTHWR